MKLHVLALDYDGTIARDGMLDAGVRVVLQRARERGFVVVLATGRMLDDLRTLLGSLAAFDAIVAENGAVLAFPESGRSMLLAPPISREFVDEALRGGLAVRAGSCVAELPAADGPAALRIVRTLGLPLTLHFNRDRLMVLPQAVSKATGLREALRTLRLSAHNAIAIGDAENDHELLSACEVGCAVAWGSRALQHVADHIVPGTGPEAVAEYLDEIVDRRRAPPIPAARRQIVLGRDIAGEVVSLALRGRNVLIAGDPRSGKSWVAGLLCEQLVLHQYSTCVIDPEGDYVALEALPGVIVLGGPRLPSVQEVARTVRHSDLSLVLDLSAVEPSAKTQYVGRILRLLTELRCETGFPHRVVVDEAHYFLHDPSQTAALDLAAGGHTLITYRTAGLDPAVVRSSECVLVTRQTDPQEAKVLHEQLCGAGTAEEWHRMLSGLRLDEAALLPTTAEAEGRLRMFRVAPRITRHVRHRHKYLDVAADHGRAFRFRIGGPVDPLAASLGDVVRVLSATPSDRLHDHVRRSDLSHWIRDVIGDTELAATVWDLEEQHRLGRLPDFNDAVIHAIQRRYGSPAHAS